jgi:pimeloyl-ACP methyl ester carboxylesterase
MATFLMIHGAWHGGWCFEPLRESLQADGHVLLAPDLPGMGTGDATLDQWGDFVATVASSQPEPVILCGHSRGGIVISEAAERAPEAVAALVYISAFLLPSGRSFFDEVRSVPRAAEFEAGLSVSQDGRSLSISPHVAKNILYHLTPPKIAESACSKLVPEPLAPAVTPLRLSGQRYGSVSRYYFECTEDRALLLAQQRSMHLAMRCRGVIALTSDHSPFASRPAELSTALKRIVNG